MKVYMYKFIFFLNAFTNNHPKILSICTKIRVLLIVPTKCTQRVGNYQELSYIGNFDNHESNIKSNLKPVKA